MSVADHRVRYVQEGFTRTKLGWWNAKYVTESFRTEVVNCVRWEGLPQMQVAPNVAEGSIHFYAANHHVRRV